MPSPPRLPPDQFSIGTKILVETAESLTRDVAPACYSSVSGHSQRVVFHVCRKAPLCFLSLDLQHCEDTESSVGRFYRDNVPEHLPSSLQQKWKAFLKSCRTSPACCLTLPRVSFWWPLHYWSAGLPGTSLSWTRACPFGLTFPS